jgi:hypothetical protein
MGKKSEMKIQLEIVLFLFKEILISLNTFIELF